MVGNNVVPLVSGGAGDERDDRFGIAPVEYFVGHAWFDVNKIAGLVVDLLFEAVPEFVANFSFDDVEDHFEIDMDVRSRDAARRNGGDVGREFPRADIFPGHALLVMNAVPIAPRSAAGRR